MARHVVGFIGVGQMGLAIAERFAEAGVELHVYDRSSAAASAAAALGARCHDSARAVADVAETVFACLPSREASRAAALGDDGVADGRRIRTLVEMSTIGSVQIQEIETALGERGIETLDAPVSGGPVGARQGTLSIMLAGRPAVREAAMPLLSMVSSRIFDIGDTPGLAQKMKLVNNLLAASNMANSFEALVLGAGLGLSPARLAEVVRQSSGNNTGMAAKFIDSILDRSFAGTAHISIIVKDLSLAAEEAAAAGLSLDALQALSGMTRLWRAAAALGLLDADVPALARIVEHDLGVTVREPGAPIVG